MSFPQLMILVCGIVSSYLVAKKNKWFVITTLIGQPFWFYETLVKDQYGMLALTVYYTGMMIVAYHTWWIKPKRSIERAQEDGCA